MKYRDHKGSFSDSMETVKDFSTIDEIKEHLNNFYNNSANSVVEIKFIHQGIDERNNWDTYIVLQRLRHETEFTVVGMSDGCIDVTSEAKQKALELIKRGENMAFFFFPNEQGKESVKLFAVQYALELVKFLRAGIDKIGFDENDFRKQQSSWFEVQFEIEKIKNQKS